MLTELHVKNIGLIEETEVSFGSGLNILTGETGAGKSMLLGSVNLALGQKMSREMLRDDAKPGLVELVFAVENPAVLARLREMDVETEDGLLIITRKIQDGRSIFRLNGEAVTAAGVRKISSLLLDIHGQHEHQSLLYPDRQLEILDAYGKDGLSGFLEETALLWKEYRGVKKALEEYQIDESEREREVSLLQYEIKEIEDASLQPGEDEELEKAYRKMANGKKIAEALGEVHRLTGYEEGAGDAVGKAVSELNAIADFDGQLEELARSLGDIDNLLNDFNREASGYLEDFTFSEEDFYETETRLDQINRLKSKYGSTLEEIEKYLRRQQEKLQKLENFEAEKKRLTEELCKAEDKLEKSSERLSEKRKECARSLASQIGEGLKELNFLSSDFEIAFSRTPGYGRNGYDAVEFRISTNPGEPLKPLSRVVSGGELSRIMLAIKSILADRDETETLIFDEIDTGISGRTAQKVSEKMAGIGKSHQVLCITHLAQIAAMADHHFEISKTVESNGTATHIRELDEESSVRELARILGGAEITPAVLESAREMKELARKLKQQQKS